MTLCFVFVSGYMPCISILLIMCPLHLVCINYIKKKTVIVRVHDLLLLMVYVWNLTACIGGMAKDHELIQELLYWSS